jgi:hypothetical protein
VGDVAALVGILWTSLRESKIDWSDISSAALIKEIEQGLINQGLKPQAEKLTPVLGAIAAIPGINRDFEAMSVAGGEAPSLLEIHKLCDPNNGVVLSVKDDIVDHNGFSPAPEPQDPTSTPTFTPTPATGGSAGGGSNVVPPVIPTPSQAPTQTPTPTTTPTYGGSQTPQNTQAQTPTPESTQTPTPPAK